MKFKKIIAGISAVVVAASALSFSAFTTVAADNVFDDLSQKEITDAMGPGWNVGNQLEATTTGTPDETAWQKTKITKELIQAVKAQGFKSVRIPISYLSYIGEAPNYTINANWLARIKEVVNYCVDEGLYAIINMHGDGYNSVQGGWLLCNAPDEKQPEIKEKYAACWEQIATLFKDYDEHLIFESMNEEFDGVTYGGNVNKTYYSNINAYNQIFVDTVRKTGGNNAKRWILIPGWNTNIDLTVGNYGFALPTDTNRDSSIPAGEQRIMVSVHYYDPWDFCGDDTDGKYSQWGKDSDPNKSASYSNTEEYMEGQLKKVNDKFVKAGYPVIVGEYGCINKSASDPENTKFRAYYDKTFCEYCKDNRCVPVYWDNGAISNSFGLFNRTTMKVEQQEILDAIVNVFLTEKEKLNNLIIRAGDLDETLYLKDSWDSFTTVLENAKEVYNNAESVDSDYTTAMANLQKAIDELVPDPNVLVETKIVTEPQISSSENTEGDNYLKSITDNEVSFSKLVQLKVTFTINGDVTDDTYAFIVKPYDNVNWSGWDDNFVYIKDCTKDENGVYTGIIDAQAVLTTYSGTYTSANGINLYYGKADPEIVLTSFSALSAQGDAHVHNYEITSRKAGTCLEPGEYNLKCKECGEIYKQTLQLGNHTYTSEITKPATCTEDGLETFTCSVCGKDSYTQPIPAGHKYENGFCSVCGEKDPNYVPPKTEQPTKTTQSTKDKSVSSIKTVVTTTAKSTRSPKAVKNDKKKAKKLMKQAKITTLNVKSKAKKKISVTWKKVKKAKGYEVQVSTNKNFKKSKIIFKKDLKKVKLTIKNKKIKSKKTYYVRVRAYATYKDKNNVVQKVYSAWNKKLRKVKVK